MYGNNNSEQHPVIHAPSIPGVPATVLRTDTARLRIGSPGRN
jgi:hypothetical protein